MKQTEYGMNSPKRFCRVLSFVQTDMSDMSCLGVSFTCRSCVVDKLGALQHRLRRDLQKSFHLKPRPLCQDLSLREQDIPRHTETKSTKSKSVPCPMTADITT